MVDFNIAVKETLTHEGGYVNNPADPGGATNMGITQADMPGVDMKTITVDQAIEYYTEHYWKHLYSQIQSQLVANKLFDMGVLFGVGTAIGLIQLALEVKADHVFGPMTLAATNQADETTLLASYKTHLVTHIFNIVAARPSSRIFLKGWSNRINS